MSLDLPIPSSVQVVVPQTVSSTTTRVKMIIFDLDGSTCRAIIAYGNQNADGSFIVLKQENWELSGDYYIGKFTLLTSGKPIAQELLGNISATVAEILGNADLKNQLLQSGELVIK